MQNHLLFCILCLNLIITAVHGQENSSQDLKTFDAWIEILFDEHKGIYERHPDLKEIEIGAAIILAAKINTQYEKNNLTDFGNQCVKNYLDFREGKGKAMLEKWKKDGVLDEKDKDYRYIIQATLSPVKSCNQNEPTGKLFVKGWKQGLFTRKEIDEMRYFLAGTAKTHSGMSYAFSSFHKSVYKMGGIDWRDTLSQFYPLPHGKAVPNFSALSYDKILKETPFSPDWYKTQFQGFLTPQYLSKYGTQFKGYSIQEINGHKKLVPDLLHATKENAECSITLNELRNKGKPLLIFSHAPADTFDFYYDVIQWNMLYPIYKNHVNFYYFTNWGISQDYIGTNNNSTGAISVVKNLVVNSSADTGLLARSPFKVRNNFIMNYPFFNHFNTLCDNRAGTLTAAFLPQYAYLFIDKNKIKCNPTENPMFGNQSLQHSLGALIYKKNNVCPRSLGYTWGYWIKFNRTIRFLKIMERLNWQYSTDDPELHEHYNTHWKTDVAEYGRYTISKGIVKDIDLKTGQLVITGADDLQKKGPVIDHVIKIHSRTRTGHKKGVLKKAGHQIHDIKVGDTVSAIYRYENNDMKNKIAIMVFRYENGRITPSGRFFIQAKIVGVDDKQGKIQVHMPKPDYPNDWKGYHYWEERIAQGAQEPSKKNKPYHIGKRLLKGSDESRSFDLVLDSAVDFSIDGREVPVEHISQVTAGDNIIFSFLYDYEGDTPLHPENVYVIKPLTNH